MSVRDQTADQLVLRPATELSALLTRGELSPVALTKAFIARAKRYFDVSGIWGER